jgi:hypothetical protein
MLGWVEARIAGGAGQTLAVFWAAVVRMVDARNRAKER